MALKYYLITNNLMTQPNAYMARSHRSDTLHSEQLADLMVQRGSTLTKSDIIAAENLRFEVIQEMLQPGFNIANQAQRVNAPKNRQPALYTLMDYESSKVNEQVSIGKTVKLTGSNLLCNQDDPKQGLFFTDAATGATLTKVHYVMEHKPSWILFEVPKTLTAGKYVFLELRSNELRKEQLQEVLLTTS